MEDRIIDKFERYLKDEMEESEKRDLKRDLQQDEQLQKQFSAYIMANKAVENEVRNDLKNKMNTWDMPRENKGGSIGVISIILIVLLGTAIVSTLWICPREEEPQWDQYAEVNVEALQRSGGPSDDIRQLNQLYVNSNYGKAQRVINDMKPELREQPDVQFIQALLNYQNKDFQDALALFSLLKDDGEAHFSISDQAQFYYLLTLIRMNDCAADCKNALKDIADDDNHLRQIEAKKLLKNISL